MSYQNSEAQKINLAKARAKAINTKNPCQYCNEEFSIVGLDKHEHNCYMNPKHYRECPVCEKPIKSKKAATCSHSCSNTHFRSGVNHGNWKQESYRSTCFAYHLKECVVCKEELIVEVHHLDEDKSNNDPSNLIPLCPTHHAYWHSRHRHIVEPAIIQYIQNWTPI